MLELDKTDKMLLKELIEDSHQQYADLGKKVNMSAPAVFARVKKLIKEEVITRFTVELNPFKIGKTVCAFIRIQGSVTSNEMAKALFKFPEIEECHAVAGEDCLIAKVYTNSTTELEEILEKIKTIRGIDRTITTISLRTHFKRGISTL